MICRLLCSAERGSFRCRSCSQTNSPADVPITAPAITSLVQWQPRLFQRFQIAVDGADTDSEMLRHIFRANNAVTLQQQHDTDKPIDAIHDPEQMRERLEGVDNEQLMTKTASDKLNLPSYNVL